MTTDISMWLREHQNHHVKPMTDDDAGPFLACFTCDPDDDFIILACAPDLSRDAEVERLVESARAALAELDIIRVHWDSRPMFVHIDTHTDLRRALTPFVNPTALQAPTTPAEDAGSRCGQVVRIDGKPFTCGHAEAEHATMRHPFTPNVR